jgi:hypothetical protein
MKLDAPILNFISFHSSSYLQGFSFQRQLVPSSSGSFPCASPKPLIEDLTQFGSLTADPFVMQLFDTSAILCAQLIIPQGT